MGANIDKALRASVGRRAFLQAAAVAAVSVGLTGCGENTLKEIDDMQSNGGSEEWITAACWHNCGGGCYNRALVKEGIVIRQKTDDNREDSWENPQQRGCLRGRSQRKQVFGPDRLKYPMKRKNWSPDDPHGEMRGKDEWERISWDEALSYVVDQIKKTCEDVGARGILYTDEAIWGSGSIWKAIAEIPEIGGLPTFVWDTASEGTYTLNMPALGMPEFDMAPYMSGVISANDKFDMLNADIIIMYGTNPAWASAGNRMRNFMAPKLAGAEMIYVGPSYNFTAAALDARWIQVRPGTDIPLLLAVAYCMLDEDDPQDHPVIDWDFLKRCTVGFTVDNLPADAKAQECFKDYVLGEYDGMPKTPEWATEICGTDVNDIRYLARALAKTNKTMFLHSFAPARNKGAEDFPQLFLTLGCMGGHVGKPGHATGAMFNFMAGDCGTALVSASSAYKTKSVSNRGGDVINATQLWDAVINGSYLYVGNPIPNNDWRPGEQRTIDIRMIYNEMSAGLQTRPASMRGIEAFRKVDFVVSHDMFLTTNARYSDIVLPVTSQWETWNNTCLGSREARYFPRQICEPLFECKSDVDIAKALMERLGADPSELFPLTDKQGYFSKLVGAAVVDEQGKKVPLVTITEKDIAAFEYPGEPQQGLVDFEEIYDKGKYQVERSADGPKAYRYIAYEDFVKDPEGHPLKSKSGKFEIYCQWKADMLNALGFSTLTFKPYPTYQLSGFGYEASFSDWGAKEKGPLPYLAYQPHYLRRSHSTFNNIPWLREAFTNPVFLSARDAHDKGVVDGDTVLIWNEYGKILRRATVLESVMPGALAIPHGSWLDLDEETGIDHGGQDEVLVGPVTSACGVSGYNNYLVDFKKYVDEELAPDCDWPSRIVDLEN